MRFARATVIRVYPYLAHSSTTATGCCCFKERKGHRCHYPEDTTEFEQEVKVLVTKAYSASKAISRGCDGPISLGKWTHEHFERLICAGPRSWKLWYRGGEILYCGDPQGPHESVIAALSKALRSYLGADGIHLRELGAEVTEFKEGAMSVNGQDRKEADQSWALSNDSGAETTLEVVWGNETMREFERELADWHRSGRHTLGIKMFWNGVAGNEAALNSIEAGSNEGFSCVFVTWDAAAPAP